MFCYPDMGSINSESNVLLLQLLCIDPIQLLVQLLLKVIIYTITITFEM